MTIRTCTMRLAFALAAGLVVSALGVTAALAGHIGSGQTSSGQMSVTANIPAVCSFNTNPMNFGNYTVTTPTPLQVKTPTDVTCSQGAPWEAEYDNGLWSAGNCITRRLIHSSGGAFLTYMLFNGDDPALPPLGLVAQLPGCTQHRGTGTGVLQQATVLGEIPPGQTAPTGPYSDTIVVTLHF